MPTMRSARSASTRSAVKSGEPRRIDACANDALHDSSRLSTRTFAAIDVHRVVHNGDHAVVAGNVDGTFDKRGLPDPLVLTFYFSSSGGKLVQLLILRNEPALSSTP